MTRVAELLATTDITLIPTINPDGFDRGTEGACSGIISKRPFSSFLLYCVWHPTFPIPQQESRRLAKLLVCHIQVAITKLVDTTKALKT